MVTGFRVIIGKPWAGRGGLRETKRGEVGEPHEKTWGTPLGTNSKMDTLRTTMGTVGETWGKINGEP